MSDEREEIREFCPCGANLKLAGSAETIREVSDAWRSEHHHMESAGVCGIPGPRRLGGAPSNDHCTLKAGHPGWHHSNDGDWTYRDPAPVTPEAAGA